VENGPTTIPLPHVGNQRLRPGFNFHKVKGDQFLIMAAVRQTSAGDTTGGSVGRECPSPSAAPIRLLLQNRTPAVAATQTRIDTAGISRSESAGHDAELADAPTPVNSQTGYSAGVTAVRMGVGGRWTCRPLRGLSLFGFGFYKDYAPDGAGRGEDSKIRLVTSAATCSGNAPSRMTSLRLCGHGWNTDETRREAEGQRWGSAGASHGDRP